MLSTCTYILHTEAKASEDKPPWSKFDDLPVNEKRKLYKCGEDYVTLNKVPLWPEYRQENLYAIYGKKGTCINKLVCFFGERINYEAQYLD